MATRGRITYVVLSGDRVHKAYRVAGTSDRAYGGPRISSPGAFGCAPPCPASTSRGGGPAAPAWPGFHRMIGARRRGLLTPAGGRCDGPRKQISQAVGVIATGSPARICSTRGRGGTTPRSRHQSPRSAPIFCAAYADGRELSTSRDETKCARFRVGSQSNSRRIRGDRARRCCLRTRTARGRIDRPCRISALRGPGGDPKDHRPA